MSETNTQHCPACEKPNLCGADSSAADCWCTKIEVNAQNKANIAKKYGQDYCLCAHCLKKLSTLNAGK